MICFEQVNKAYNNQTLALKNIQLDILEGSLVVLIGESGSGKSTLLKCINKLVSPSSGNILFNGKNIADLDSIEYRRSIGFVTQSGGLFPHMTLLENVGLSLKITNTAENEIISRAKELFELIDLDYDSFSKRYPHEVSGGQAQRFSLARALATKTKTLLLDEPFSALDPITKLHLQKSLLDIHKKLGLTTVLVTHDMSEAIYLADSIVILKDGEIIANDSANNLLKSPNEYIQNLIQAPLEHSVQIQKKLGLQNE